VSYFADNAADKQACIALIRQPTHGAPISSLWAASHMSLSPVCDDKKSFSLGSSHGNIQSALVFRELFLDFQKMYYRHFASPRTRKDGSGMEHQWHRRSMKPLPVSILQGIHTSRRLSASSFVMKSKTTCSLSCTSLGRSAPELLKPTRSRGDRHRPLWQRMTLLLKGILSLNHSQQLLSAIKHNVHHACMPYPCAQARPRNVC